MGVAGAWVAGYLGLVAIGAASVIARREATLVRGATLLRLNAVVVALALGATFLTTRTLPRTLLLGAALVLVASWRFRRAALGIHADMASVGETIEHCLRRLCAPFERVPAGYVVALPNSASRIRLRAIGRFATLIEFAGPARHRKVALLESLLAKQYRGVLPTIRIKSREQRGE